MNEKVTNFLQENYLLIVVIIGSFLVRVVGVTLVPPSLNWDEVSHGYNAYSILKTGNDEWGKTLPIIFRAYGDYKLPVYIYLTALSEFVFGMNSLAVRLPSIVAGTSLVPFTYLLVRYLEDKRVALMGAFLVALEPWSLFLSRGAFEANLALTFFVAGLYFLLSGLRKKNYKLLIALFLFGLSVWTYNSARVFVPIFLLVILVLNYKEILKLFHNHKRIGAAGLIILIFFFAPMFVQLLSPVGRARYGWVSILDSGAIAKIFEYRQSSDLPANLSRILYNRVTYFSFSFVKNWLSHFSPAFLFFKGGSNYQFSLPNHGLIYLINLPFFLIGIFALIKKKIKKGAILLAWILLAPIPSSLTRESPHVLRSIFMIPVPMILTSFGLFYVWGLLKKNIKALASFFYFLLIFLSFENYVTYYYSSYRNEYSWSWQYGYAQVVDFVKANYTKYDKIIISKKYGEPHEFVLFYWPWEPQKYQKDENLIRFYQSNWYWVDRFDKFYFVNDWEIVNKNSGKEFELESGGIVDCTMEKCLLITSPDNKPLGWKLKDKILFLDGKGAFEFYEN